MQKLSEDILRNLEPNCDTDVLARVAKIKIQIVCSNISVFFLSKFNKKREFWNLEIKLKVFNNFFQCFSILCLVLHSKLAALKIFYPEKTTWQAIDWIQKIFTLKK